MKNNYVSKINLVRRTALFSSFVNLLVSGWIENTQILLFASAFNWLWLSCHNLWKTLLDTLGENESEKTCQCHYENNCDLADPPWKCLGDPWGPLHFENCSLDHTHLVVIYFILNIFQKDIKQIPSLTPSLLSKDRYSVFSSTWNRAQ